MAGAVMALVMPTATGGINTEPQLLMATGRTARHGPGRIFIAALRFGPGKISAVDNGTTIEVVRRNSLGGIMAGAIHNSPRTMVTAAFRNLLGAITARAIHNLPGAILGGAIIGVDLRNLRGAASSVVTSDRTIVTLLTD
jgi:hypothetical protein